MVISSSDCICVYDLIWPEFTFIGGQRDHHCQVPEDSTVNDTIPYTSKGTLEKCVMYKDISVSNETESCQNGYHYYGNAGPTIVSEVSFTLSCMQVLKVAATSSGYNFLIFSFLMYITVKRHFATHLTTYNSHISI